MWKFLSVFLVVFSSLATYGLEVTVGGGKVIVQSVAEGQSIDKLQLETDLLVDESIAEIVMDSNLVNIKLDAPALDQNTAKEKILKQLKLKLKKQADNQGIVLEDEGEKLVVFGSSQSIEYGESYNEVVVVGGSLELKGTVKKLSVMGGHVHVFPTGVISEEVNIIGGKLTKDEGAQVKGYKQTTFGGKDWWFNINGMDLNFLKGGEKVVKVWWEVVKLFMIFLLMLLLDKFSPSYQRESSGYLNRHPVKSFFWGIGFNILFIPGLILLVITIIGILLTPIYFSLFTLFYLLGWGHFGRLVGKWLCQKFENLDELLNDELWKVTALGLVIIQAITFLPMAGPFLSLIMTLCGLGAVTLTFMSFFSSKLAPSKK